MRLRESRDGDIHVLHLAGEIDLHYAPVLRSLFQQKAARCCPYLVLDLSDVDHIDSTGIAVLLEYLRDATLFDSGLCVGGISDHVRSIFTIVQLQKVIPVFDNLDEAKRAVRDGLLPKPQRALFGEREEMPADASASCDPSAPQLRGREEAIELGSITENAFAT